MSRLPETSSEPRLSPGQRVLVQVRRDRPLVPGEVVAASRREEHWVVRLQDGREETFPAGAVRLSGFQPPGRGR